MLSKQLLSRVEVIDTELEVERCRLGDRSRKRVLERKGKASASCLETVNSSISSINRIRRLSDRARNSRFRAWLKWCEIHFHSKVAWRPASASCTLPSQSEVHTLVKLTRLLQRAQDLRLIVRGLVKREKESSGAAEKPWTKNRWAQGDENDPQATSEQNWLAKSDPLTRFYPASNVKLRQWGWKNLTVK